MNELNEHGVPLHACSGYRQDEHYWAWLRYLRTHRLGQETRQWLTLPASAKARLIRAFNVAYLTFQLDIEAKLAAL